MTDIRLIAAVGRHGQLGLGGKLPWHDPLDLRWFRDQTMGGVVLFGGRTFEAVGDLPGRTKLRWSGRTQPFGVLQAIGAKYKGKVIWIAGGSHTYKTFMPFVRLAVITRVEYDGEADAYMPPLWGNHDNGATSSGSSEHVTISSDGGPAPPALLLPDPPPQTPDSSVVRERRASGWLSRNRRKWNRRTA
jgi:dihydromethanopterin reductase